MVIDSRGTKARGIRRRRKCIECGHRFTTYERHSVGAGERRLTPREIREMLDYLCNRAESRQHM
jgi:hypothetical protein